MPDPDIMRATIPLLVASALTVGSAVSAAPAVASPTAVPEHSASVASKPKPKRPAPHSKLQIAVSGTPQGKVQVTGPKTHLTVTESSQLSLPVGTYRLHATNVVVAGDAFVPNTRHWRVRLHRGTKKIVTVRYSHIGSSAPGSTDDETPPAGELGVLFSLVNEARSRVQQCGPTTMPAVDPVVYDSELGSAAASHAQDMATKDYFDHDSLDGRTFVDRVAVTRYSGQAAGENIAMGFQSASGVVQGWLNSPGHCLNLMNPEFDEMGLGLASRQDPRYDSPVTYWVQDFGYAPAGD